MNQAKTVMLAVLVALPATTGLVTALSMMSQTALAFGCGTGGGSIPACSDGGTGSIGGFGGGGTGTTDSGGNGFGSGEFHCGGGHGGTLVNGGHGGGTPGGASTC